jgi:hypothetical protein
VDNVADELSELRLAGERLVEVLRDQLADGQTETLWSLSSGAQALRQHVDELVRATEQLAQAAAEVSTEVGAQISTHVVTEIQQGMDAARGQLKSFAGATARSTEKARSSMEWVVSTGVERLGEATAALAAERAVLEQALSVAGEALVARVRAAAVTATGLIQVEAADAVVLLEDVFVTAAQALTDRSEAVEALIQDSERSASARLASLQKQVADTERREQAAADRLQTHFEALVERIDATAGATLTRLVSAADDLAQRDAQLEQRRAEEFVRVLDALLSESGAGGRRLRDRIRRGVETQRTEAPQPPPRAPVAPDAPRVRPASTPPLPPDEPAPRAVAVARAAATKPAAGRAPAKKAATKKAATKKAAPRTTASRATPPTPPPADQERP